MSLRNNDYLFAKFDSTTRKYNKIKKSLSDMLLDSLSWQYKNNGNIGSSFNRLVFSDEVGFASNSLNKSALYYFNKLKQNEILLPNRPYTEVFYTSGSKKETYFYISHFQKIKDKFLFGLKQNVLSSLSFYNKEKANHRFFTIYGMYYQKQYRVLAKFDFMNFRQNENGGLTNESNFIAESSTNSLLYPVNLSAAIRSNRIQNYTIDQSLNINNSSSKHKLILFNKNLYSNERNYYLDTSPTASFYPFPIYTTILKDTFNITTLKTNIGFCLKNPNSQFEISAEQSNSKVIHNKLDTVFNQTLLMLNYDFSVLKSFLFKINFNYGLNGYYYDDYIANISLSNKKKGKVNFDLSAGRKKIHQNFFNSYYSSPVFNWSYQFNSQNSLFSKSILDIYKFKFVFESQSIHYYVYYDKFMRPKEYNHIKVYTLQLNREFVIRRISLDMNNLVQQSSNPNIVSLPLYLLNYKLSYSFRLLKGLLNNKFGVEATYFAKFKPNAYMPYTGIYYLQDQKEYGNYPYIDIFATTTFKQAQFFIKLQHVNAGLNGQEYINTPNYPYPGRTFRFGILWKIWG
ncbi:MAG: putative porin [Bacteroidota bacterium]